MARAPDLLDELRPDAGPGRGGDRLRRRRARRGLTAAAAPRAGCDHRGDGTAERQAARATPDHAFAYIDSEGKRRLPIHDPAHVRAALSRFNQVAFEDDAARDQARTRLLRAAKKHGIVPIGFIDVQLQPHRRLPKGTVTFLMTDLEGSTELLGRPGDACALAVFERAPAALAAALEIQRAMPPGDSDARLWIGLHSGRPKLTENGYVGLSVHTVASPICFAGHGGQIPVSGPVHEAVRDSAADGARITSLGGWRFQGLNEAIELFQVDAEGEAIEFPPLRAATPAAER